MQIIKESSITRCSYHYSKIEVCQNDAKILIILSNGNKEYFCSDKHWLKIYEKNKEYYEMLEFEIWKKWENDFKNRSFERLNEKVNFKVETKIILPWDQKIKISRSKEIFKYKSYHFEINKNKLASFKIYDNWELEDIKKQIKYNFNKFIYNFKYHFDYFVLTNIELFKNTFQQEVYFCEECKDHYLDGSLYNAKSPIIIVLCGTHEQILINKDPKVKELYDKFIKNL